MPDMGHGCEEKFTIAKTRVNIVAGGEGERGHLVTLETEGERQ